MCDKNVWQECVARMCDKARKDLLLDDLREEEM